MCLWLFRLRLFLVLFSCICINFFTCSRYKYACVHINFNTVYILFTRFIFLLHFFFYLSFKLVNILCCQPVESSIFCECWTLSIEHLSMAQLRIHILIHATYWWRWRWRVISLNWICNCMRLWSLVAIEQHMFCCWLGHCCSKSAFIVEWIQLIFFFFRK